MGQAILIDEFTSYKASQRGHKAIMESCSLHPDALSASTAVPLFLPFRKSIATICCNCPTGMCDLFKFEQCTHHHQNDLRPCMFHLPAVRFEFASDDVYLICEAALDCGIMTTDADMCRSSPCAGSRPCTPRPTATLPAAAQDNSLYKTPGKALPFVASVALQSAGEHPVVHQSDHQLLEARVGGCLDVVKFCPLPSI